MNKLKVKATIPCPTCGELLPRQKTFKTSHIIREDAIEAHKEEIDAWAEKMRKTDCRVCNSIKNATQPL